MKEAPWTICGENTFKKTALQLGVKVTESDIGTVEADSQINSQPVGLAEIFTGARNRLRASREKGVQGRVCAIENGIVELIPDQWVDLAVVLIEDENQIQGMSTSIGIPVPLEVIKKVLEIGPDKTTIGTVLAEMFPEVDHKNPHLHFTHGVISRQDLLTQAVEAAYANLLYQQSLRKS